MAEELGVNIEKNCRTISTQGVGGTSKAYLLGDKMEVKIGEYYRKIPIGFLHNDYIPPLLGRQEFLETFKVVFEKFHAMFI